MKERKYNYRRNLPHFEKSGRAHFITFDTCLRWELPPVARDLVLEHCLHDNGSKMRLYIAVVMPDHVHMVFMPLENDKDETFSFEEIVGAIKGASSHSVNRALKRAGLVWQDESFDHVVRHEDSLEQKIQYVPGKSCEEEAGSTAGRLQVAVAGKRIKKKLSVLLFVKFKTHSRGAPPPQLAKTRLAAAPGLCHTSIVATPRSPFFPRPVWPG